MKLDWVYFSNVYGIIVAVMYVWYNQILVLALVCLC